LNFLYRFLYLPAQLVYVEHLLRVNKATISFKVPPIPLESNSAQPGLRLKATFQKIGLKRPAENRIFVKKSASRLIAAPSGGEESPGNAEHPAS